jgi:hypothetical protein
VRAPGGARPYSFVFFPAFLSAFRFAAHLRRIRFAAAARWAAEKWRFFLTGAAVALALAGVLSHRRILRRPSPALRLARQGFDGPAEFVTLRNQQGEDVICWHSNQT